MAVSAFVKYLAVTVGMLFLKVPALLFNHKNTNTRIMKQMTFDDPVDEELYGLFLKVKDSPRHIPIKADLLLKEAKNVCEGLYQDKQAEKHLTEFEQNILTNLGWHYAPSLIMSMVYGMMRMKGKQTRKAARLMDALEQAYGHCCYWHAFHKAQLPRITIRRPKTIIYQVQHLHVAHADVAVGVAESGATVYHH